MEFDEVLKQRRSSRRYGTTPIPRDILHWVYSAALSAPSAGNTWAIDIVSLDERTAVKRYWDVTLPVGQRRSEFQFQGLLTVPVLALVCTHPDAYVSRYAEADKAHPTLGTSVDHWPVPYWWVDAGAAIQAMLLAATYHGLGSLLFGAFDHEHALINEFSIPNSRRIVGVVALGYRVDTQPVGRSQQRTRPRVEQWVHSSGW